MPRDPDYFRDKTILITGTGSRYESHAGLTQPEESAVAA